MLKGRGGEEEVAAVLEGIKDGEGSLVTTTAGS